MVKWHDALEAGKASINSRMNLLSRSIFALRSIMRVLMLTSVILGAIIGKGVLAADKSTIIGLVVAVCTALYGTLHELAMKLSQRLNSASDMSNIVLVANIKLTKAVDMAIEDEKVTAAEYGALIDILTSGISEIGGKNDTK